MKLTPDTQIVHLNPLSKPRIRGSVFVSYVDQGQRRHEVVVIWEIPYEEPCEEAAPVRSRRDDTVVGASRLLGQRAEGEHRLPAREGSAAAGRRGPRRGPIQVALPDNVEGMSATITTMLDNAGLDAARGGRMNLLYTCFQTTGGFRDLGGSIVKIKKWGVAFAHKVINNLGNCKFLQIAIDFSGNEILPEDTDVIDR